MQTTTKALMVGTIAGILLLSLVVSLGFTYTTTRTAVAYVVNDDAANIALIPNNNNLQSGKGYFAQISSSNGELEINFGNVAPSTTETLNNVFYVENTLNEPVSVTITVEGNTNSYSISVTPYSFTLQPGQTNEVPISITLNTGSATPGSTLQFTIQISASYSPASSGGGSGSGSGSGS